MLKRKPKVLTPEQVEAIRTKDFFDMILPGTVKFLSDHYILGDSYRCVWAIREYPPSTEEQANPLAACRPKRRNPPLLSQAGREHGTTQDHPKRHPPQQAEKWRHRCERNH